MSPHSAPLPVHAFCFFPLVGWCRPPGCCKKTKQLKKIIMKVKGKYLDLKLRRCTSQLIKIVRSKRFLSPIDNIMCRIWQKTQEFEFLSLNSNNLFLWPAQLKCGHYKAIGSLWSWTGPNFWYTLNAHFTRHTFYVYQAPHNGCYNTVLTPVRDCLVSNQFASAFTSVLQLLFSAFA